MGAMLTHPFAAEELQEDAELCAAEAQRLRTEAKALASQARIAQLDAESYDLLADMSRRLAASAVMLQEAGL